MATIDLCTFDDILNFKDNHVNISENNTLIENLITRKSTQICNYCNREQFQSKTYIQYYDGSGGKRLFVDVWPIISIISIYDDTDWSWGSNTLIDSDDYRSVDSRSVVMKSSYFTNGDQNIKITYVAGYSDVPEDVKHICIKEVVREFTRRKDFDIISKSLDDGSVSYQESGLLPSTKEVLIKYVITGIV